MNMWFHQEKLINFILHVVGNFMMKEGVFFSYFVGNIFEVTTFSNTKCDGRCSKFSKPGHPFAFHPSFYWQVRVCFLQLTTQINKYKIQDFTKVEKY